MLPIPLLSKLFNCCIETKKIPNEWKFAELTPLFKGKGDKCEINNYRGISVLPPVSKVFEKLPANQIKCFFNVNKLFFEGQHGFRSGHSCESALHELVTELNIWRDKRLIAMLLFIDFRKAFDLVDWRLLLLKLFHYGFDNSSLSLLENYFSNRSVRVKLGNFKSKEASLCLGVPQGSVLGPLLFLIFINDLPFILKNISAKLFADDTTLYKAHENLDILIGEFITSLEPLLNWCIYNRLDINWSKCFFMFVSNKRVVYPTSINIKGLSILVVNEFKLLGVVIDNKLTFTKYVATICTTVNKKLFSIKRLFYLSTSVKIQFFKTFILPHFDYCLSLSIYYSKTLLQKLSNLFYLCLAKLFKFNLFYMDPSAVNNFLEGYNLFSFQHRLILKLLTFSFKIYSNNDSPPLLKSQLNLNSTRNISYNLRNKEKFCNIKSSNKFGDLTFCHVFSNLINVSCCDLFTDKSVNFNFFKCSIFNNINILYSKIISKIPKFNLKYCDYSYFVK